VHHEGRTTADELIRNADAAMYVAKASSRGSWQVFERAMHDAALARLELEGELRGAIDRRELVLHYQPLVSLETGETVGVEALLRWQHPTRGLVAPMQFVPIAEDTGLILPIGAWVLNEARQLFDPGFVDMVAEIIGRSRIEPRQLTLEITESVLMEDTSLAVRQLNALKDLGVRIAIDDFGTGYSSLSYLRSFPVDVLKIDKSFSDNVAVDVEGESFVRAILHLAQVLRVTTVAEGIEQPAQADRLRELGCDQAQGFYFGRPAPEAVVRIAPSRSLAATPILEAS
jgi:EAL domain-containing protein (putative c-di-GMP-specific phosphodiesterase class I)